MVFGSAGRVSSMFLGRPVITNSGPSIHLHRKRTCKSPACLLKERHRFTMQNGPGFQGLSLFFYVVVSLGFSHELKCFWRCYCDWGQHLYVFWSSVSLVLGVSALNFTCPPALEEHDSLTSHDGATTALTAGFLFDLNLETSIPDTYRPPPAPLPYDVVLGHPQSIDSESLRETISGSSFETLATCEDPEESDFKTQSGSLPPSPKKFELPRSNETNISIMEEEDVCPICLEGAVFSAFHGN
ncbi:hypothetical protein L1049_013520 [Liquidambar formosana]|uniref:Uncharacterized protein n=1 Tax=Liquidambar formosana TaxID=63359 RepID=A0AAP0RM01_LIQFO